MAYLVRLDLQLHGTTAIVSLGAGHASAQTVQVQRSSTALHFALPGIPSPVTATLRLHAGKLTGSARQGSAIGRLQLAPSKPTLARYLGTYRLANGDAITISDYRRLALPTWFENMGTDDLRGLYRLNSTQYAIGSGESVREPSAGSIQFARDGSSFTESLLGNSDVHAARISFRQQEVRFANGKVTLAATLTLPSGVGPLPAVVMVHSAGPSQRDEEQNFVGFFAAMESWFRAHSLAS